MSSISTAMIYDLVKTIEHDLDAVSRDLQTILTEAKAINGDADISRQERIQLMSPGPR
jgi:hypothetical protein